MTSFSWFPYQNHIAKIRFCYDIRKCLCVKCELFNIISQYQ
nr:MAG TPA: hypothetical protein [Caudoviricetes sp.]